MADQIPRHSKAMATILSLFNVPRGPGTFKQHNMASPMQGETETTGSIGRKQQIADSALKSVHSLLTFRGALATGQELPSDLLMKQPQRINKTAEQHNSLTSGAKLIHKGANSRQLEFSGNPAQGREHSQ